MRALRWLPLFYLSLICGTQAVTSGCLAESGPLNDPCYDDCAKGADGDKCRELCDSRPDPGGH